MIKVLPLNLNIFIGNLPKHLSREEIIKYFEALEKIERIQLPIDDGSSENKGYMYLKCKTKDSFLRLMNMNHQLGGATLVLREYFEHVDKPRVLNLKIPKSIIFLKNIPSDVTHCELLEKFSEFGAVSSVLAFKGKKKDKKLFVGYVQFKMKESIDKIPSEVSLRNWRLRWKRYKTKGLNEIEEKFRIEFKQKKIKKKISYTPKSPFREFYACLSKSSDKSGYRHTDKNLNLNKNFEFGKNSFKRLGKNNCRVY